jgi:hypothetical protein
MDSGIFSILGIFCLFFAIFLIGWLFSKEIERDREKRYSRPNERPQGLTLSEVRAQQGFSISEVRCIGQRDTLGFNDPLSTVVVVEDLPVVEPLPIYTPETKQPPRYSFDSEG